MKWLCGELGIPGWSWDCDTVQYVLQGSQPEIFGFGAALGQRVWGTWGCQQGEEKSFKAAATRTGFVTNCRGC